MHRLVLIPLLCLVLYSIARADPSTQPATPDPAIQKAIDAGVRYIVSKQNPDGSLSDIDPERTAVTAFAIMALKSAGVQMSQQSATAASLRKAMDWMLQDVRLRPDGYYGTDGSMMYTHGFVTQMLGQMSGSGVDEKQNGLIKDRLTKAVALILDAQKSNPTGGWRYRADSVDADICVTACEIRALTAARKAGITVPDEAFSKAADFIKSCAADLGGFCYFPGTPTSWSRTASGLLAIQLCGQGDSPEAKLALEYLQARDRPADMVYYLYGCPEYVAALGAASADDLETAKSNVAKIVLKFQQKDGSWTGWTADNEHGQVYCTAQVILSLTAKR